MKKKPILQRIELAPGELEILEMFWNHGPLTLAQSDQVYNAPNRRITYSTMQTRLQRLVDKGLVHREGEYRSVFSAAIKKERITEQYANLLDSLCGESIAPMVAHILQKRKLKPDEIALLEKLIAESPDEPPTPSLKKNRGGQNE